MKKIILHSSLALAGVACIILTCGFLPSHPKNNTSPETKGSVIISSTSTCTPTVPLVGEDLIKVDLDTIDPLVGKLEIGAAMTSFSIVTTQAVIPLPFLRFTLTADDICNLQNKAYSSLVPDTAVYYVTALQIEYGISISGAAPPFTYQYSSWVRPLYLYANQYTNSGGVLTGNYVATPQELQQINNPYYQLLEDGTLTLDSKNQNAIDASNYQQYISIKHYPADPNNSFNPTTDVTSAVYPFQEIDSLLLVNATYGYVNLIHVGVKRANLDGTIPSELMTDEILIGPGSLYAGPHFKAFPTNFYADLGNMCLPDCPNGDGVYLILKN
jgi:hypothetical protein